MSKEDDFLAAVREFELVKTLLSVPPEQCSNIEPLKEKLHDLVVISRKYIANADGKAECEQAEWHCICEAKEIIEFANESPYFS